MTFEALASSSAGNAYVVCDDMTRILIECGISHTKLQKLCGFKLSDFHGCFVSHEHKDHAKAVEELISRGMDVYMSQGTADALGSDGSAASGGESDLSEWQRSANEEGAMPPTKRPGTATGKTLMSGTVNIVRHLEQVNVGTLDIVPFTTFHDAREPLGFLVKSRLDGDVLAFATDTVNLRYRFPGLTILAIEANYDREILARCENMPEKVRYRITRSHMEIDTLCDYLRTMDLNKCREIHLLHLSDATSHEGHFINKVARAVPAGIRVTACAKERKV